MKTLPAWFPFAALSACLLCSCHPKQRFDSHGLRSIEIRMDEEEMGSLYGSSGSGIDFPAKVLIDGVEQDANVSIAGASTSLNSKKSFNLELKDGGYRGAKTIRLAALTGDPSMIRPYLALEVFSAVGIPTSWAEPAFAYLNERVLGLYLLIERVDEDFFKNRSIAWERTYEANGDADFGPTFESRIDLAFEGKPKPPNLDAMIELHRILLVGDDAEFERKIFSILDRDAVVAYMAGAQYVNHWDGFNKNLFYYQLAGFHKILLAPWDFDLIWAGDRAGIGVAWYLNDLFLRLASLSSVQTAIAAKISALRAGAESEANLENRVDEWKAKMAEGYAFDPWLGRAGRNLDAEAATLKARMSDWVSKL